MKYSVGKGQAYAPRYSVGDKIGILLDLNKQRLVFYLNHQKQPVAFSNLNTSKSYIPAVSLTPNCQLKLSLDQPVPMDE